MEKKLPPEHPENCHSAAKKASQLANPIAGRIRVHFNAGNIAWESEQCLVEFGTTDFRTIARRDTSFAPAVDICRDESNIHRHRKDQLGTDDRTEHGLRIRSNCRGLDTHHENRSLGIPAVSAARACVETSSQIHRDNLRRYTRNKCRARAAQTLFET